MNVNILLSVVKSGRYVMSFEKMMSVRRMSSLVFDEMLRMNGFVSLFWVIVWKIVLEIVRFVLMRMVMNICGSWMF